MCLLQGGNAQSHIWYSILYMDQLIYDLHIIIDSVVNECKCENNSTKTFQLEKIAILQYG